MDTQRTGWEDDDGQRWAEAPVLISLRIGGGEHPAGWRQGMRPYISRGFPQRPWNCHATT